MRRRPRSAGRQAVHGDRPALPGDSARRSELVGRQIRPVEVRRERRGRLGQGDRADDDGAERETEVAEHVGRRARHAGQLRGHTVQRHGRHRAHAQREADADQQVGHDEGGQAGVRDVESRAEEAADGHQGEARRQQPARGDAVQQPGDDRDQDERGPLEQQERDGDAQRVLVLDRTEPHARREARAEEGEHADHGDDGRHREGTVAEQAQVEDRGRGAHFDQDEAGEEDQTEHPGQDDGKGRPTGLGPLDGRVQDQDETGRERDLARDVELAALGRLRLGGQQQREHHAHDGQSYEHPEGSAPGTDLGEHPAEEGREGRTGGQEPAPQRDRLSPLPRSAGDRREHGERAGEQGAGAETVERRADPEDLHAGCDRGHCTADGQDARARGDQPLAAEPVAEHAEGEFEADHGDHEGRGDPGQLRTVGVQILLEQPVERSRQRVGDLRHEHRAAGGSQRPRVARFPGSPRGWAVGRRCPFVERHCFLPGWEGECPAVSGGAGSGRRP